MFERISAVSLILILIIFTCFLTPGLYLIISEKKIRPESLQNHDNIFWGIVLCVAAIIFALLATVFTTLLHVQ